MAVGKSGHQQIAHEIVSEGFAVSCWTYGRFVVVSARPRRPRQPGDDAVPALPSRSRIVVWGDGGGQIRDRVRRRTPRARFRAWLHGVPFPSREAQLEALTDELLAAIGEAPGGDGWGERGGAANIPQAPIRLPGQRPADLDGGHAYWGPAVVVLSVAAALALAGALALLRDTGATDATEMPPQPVQIGELADGTGLPPGAAGPAGASTAEAGDPSPAPAIDDASSAAEIALPPPEADAGVDGAADEAAEPAAAVAAVEYVVRSGDVLWVIAREHAVELDELLEANALDGEATIHPGQVLRIPGTRVTAVTGERR